MLNYFSLFDLPPAFALDPKELEQRYFTLQRRFHPDRLTHLPANDRAAAMQQSVDVNQGYQLLKSPIKRAQHLLALEGVFVNSERDNVKPSHALLMEIMDWRERLGQEKDAVRQEVLAAQAEALGALECNFVAGDFPNAAQATMRLHYIAKLIEDMK